MRFTGRNGWQASYKDTWSLDSTLSPIIYAGLVKFKEVITNKDWAKGVPAQYVTWGIEDPEDGEFEAAFNKFLADIDKMIYAFKEDKHYYKRGSLERLERQKKCEEGRMIFAEMYDTLWW